MMKNINNKIYDTVLPETDRIIKTTSDLVYGDTNGKNNENGYRTQLMQIGSSSGLSKDNNDNYIEIELPESPNPVTKTKIDGENDNESNQDSDNDNSEGPNKQVIYLYLNFTILTYIIKMSVCCVYVSK